MPKFNVVTGQTEYEPWEIPMMAPQGVNQAQAASVPPPEAPPAMNQIAGNPITQRGGDNMAYYNQLLKEFDMLQKAQRSKTEESLSGQKRGISQLEQSLQDYKGLGPAIDFSPLAAGYDALYGTNLAAGLKGAETPQDRLSKLSDLQNKIQMAKDQLSENRIKASEKDLGNLIQRAGINNSRQERFDTAQMEKADKEMRDQFNKLEGGATELAGTYSRLTGAFQPDQKGEVSVYEVKQAMSNFARSVGGEKGVLTDSDVGRQLPSSMQMQLSSLENYIFGLGDNAKLPAGAIAPLKSIMEKAKSVASERYKQDLNRLKRNYDTSPAPITQKVWQSAGRTRYDDATKTIDRQFGAPAAPAATQAPGSDFEAWKARKGQ